MRILRGFAVSCIAVFFVTVHAAAEEPRKPVMRSAPIGETMAGIAISPDGRFAATAPDGNGAFRLWDARTLKPIRVLDASDVLKYAVCFSPDGKHLALGVSGTGVVVLDTATWKAVATLRSFADARIQSISFSGDGRYLAATGSEDDPGLRARAWNVPGWSLKKSYPYTNNHVWVTASAFSPDGKRLVIGGAHDRSDMPVFVYDVESGSRVRDIIAVTKDEALSGDLVKSIAYSPDGARIMVCLSRIKIFDAGSGNTLHTIATLDRHSYFVNARYSPDGKYIAAIAKYKYVVIIDASSGAIIREFRADGGFAGLAFTPDGKYLALVGGYSIHYYDWR